jgi:hypothetical protein
MQHVMTLCSLNSNQKINNHNVLLRRRFHYTTLEREAVPKRLQEITTPRCVTKQRSSHSFIHSVACLTTGP